MLDCSQESRAQQVTRAGESAKNHGFCIINHGSCSENEELCTGNHGFCINDDGICSENDGFCSENDGICIENDIFCIENEKSSKSPGRPYGHVGVDTGALPYEHLFREQDAADDDDDGAVSGVSWAFLGRFQAFLVLLTRFCVCFVLNLMGLIQMEGVSCPQKRYPLINHQEETLREVRE